MGSVSMSTSSETWPSVDRVIFSDGVERFLLALGMGGGTAEAVGSAAIGAASVVVDVADATVFGDDAAFEVEEDEMGVFAACVGV